MLPVMTDPVWTTSNVSPGAKNPSLGDRSSPGTGTGVAAPLKSAGLVQIPNRPSRFEMYVSA